MTIEVKKMKIPFFTSDQTKYLPLYFESFKKKSVQEFEKDSLVEKITTKSFKVTSRIDFSFFWNYDIFPKNIMSHLTQWNHENRNIKVGDIIIQQVFLPPLQYLSYKLIFGVIITDIYEDKNKKSFTYRTLEGHAEIGEATFTLERTSPSNITFIIHTFSQPNNVFLGIFQKKIALLYQSFCTRMAINYVQRKLHPR